MTNEHEWTIDIESPVGVLHDADHLERLHHSLHALGDIAAPSLSGNLRTGVANAIFQVYGPDEKFAADYGFAAFAIALMNAQLELPADGRFRTTVTREAGVDVIHAGDTFALRLTAERETTPA